MATTVLLFWLSPGPHLIRINSWIYTFSCIIRYIKREQELLLLFQNEKRDKYSSVINLGRKIIEATVGGSALCLQNQDILEDVWTFVDPRENNCRFAAAKAGPNKWNEISCIFWIRVFNIYQHIYVSKMDV